MTLTIEIPDDIANRALSLPDLQREQLAIHAVVNAWQTAVNEDEEAWELSEDDIAAIQEGIDDAEAGRTVSFEEAKRRFFGADGSAESIVATANSLLAEHDRNNRLQKLEAA